MRHDRTSIEEAAERIRNTSDCQTFQQEIRNLQEYLKQMPVEETVFWEIEKRAYFLKNEYSDWETRKNMEEAKGRVLFYIENYFNKNDVHEQLLTILNNFYSFLEALKERKPHKSAGIQKEQLASLEIKNEYDVQHLLYACIKLMYPEARTEVNEDTGYSTVRADIFIDADHVVEVKCTREHMKIKKLIEEIEADMVHYSASNIYFFLYDKEKIIEDPMVFKQTYEGKIKGKRIHLVIHQPKFL